MVTYPIDEHISLLSKGAYFEGRSGGPSDIWRWWLEATLKI